MRIGQGSREDLSIPIHDSQLGFGSHYESRRLPSPQRNETDERDA
jgi:hypothetical protein